MIKICEYCTKEYFIKDSHAHKRFTCSKSCGMKRVHALGKANVDNLFQVGHKTWNKGMVGYTNSGSYKKGHKGQRGEKNHRYGKPIHPVTSKAVTESNKRRVEEKGSSWKGDDVGYSGLHKWVAKHRGNPNKCEHCGTTDAVRFEWANKSGEYKRDLEDWLRLCKPCHYQYDDIGVKMWATRNGAEW